MDFVREHTTNRPCVPLCSLCSLWLKLLAPSRKIGVEAELAWQGWTSFRRPSPSTLVTLQPPRRRSRISRVRALVLILVLLPALPAPADVIHLKNGRTIWADQVRENANKDRVEYDLGEDTYAIPKSSVDHIDAGAPAPVHAAPGAPAPHATPPAPSFDHEAD